MSQRGIKACTDCVARIVGVYGDGGITEHGFRTSGRDDDLLVWCRVSPLR
jgi:hypothetical protein